MKPKEKAGSPKLKVKLPFAFEAEGEGITPILCIFVLSLLFMVLGFFSFR